MKVYKEKQFLVFDFEDGKNVKYDFATKQTIGKKGKVVNDLKSQLKGYSIEDIIDCCTDKQYGKFLKFVQREYSRSGYGIWNVGTILSKVPYYSNYEQLFSAGIDDIVGSGFNYKINDIPKGLIKLCRTHKIKLSNEFLTLYKKNPDAYLMAYNMEYISLTDDDVYAVLTMKISIKEYYGTRQYDYNYKSVYVLEWLLKEHKYTLKGLMNYLDYLKTFEALDNVYDVLRELGDYVNMVSELSPKFEKYPKHFLTTHRIASRNYNRLKQKFEEDKFKNRIDKSLERTFGDYRFYYPDSTDDIKCEATQQNNCVASYIQRVIDGDCHILFLRLKDRPDESLVTIEVREVDGVYKIVQAKRAYNHDVSKEESEIINKFNKWQENKNKNNTNESEELSYVS